MVDLKDEFVQRGLGTIRRLLQEGVERKIFKPEQVDQILSRVTGTTDFKALADADIVIAASDAQFFDPHVSVGQVVAIEAIGLIRRPACTALQCFDRLFS
jgi:hypothetical protein